MDGNQLIKGRKKEVVVIENLRVDGEDPKSFVLVDTQTFTIEYLDEPDVNLPESLTEDAIGEDGEVPRGTSSAKCAICSRCYISVIDKKRHELSHFEIKPYTCQFCSRLYILSSKYYTHVCLRHQKHRIHPGYKNNTKQIGNNQAYCHICEEIFDNVRELQEHERILHTRELPYDCKVCQQRFSTSNERNYHYCNISIDHNKTDTFPCKKCSKYFLDFEALNSHSLEHFIDDGCGFLGVNDAIIKEHWEKLQEHSKQQLDDQQLDDNNLLIEDSSNPLNNLIEIVSDNGSIIDGDDPTVKCDICYKNFQTELELRRHQVKHFTFKPKKCDKCTKSFVLTSDFAMHDCMKNYILRDPRKKCNICYTSFLLPNLKVHERIHTGEVLFSKSGLFSGTLRNVKENNQGIYERNNCFVCPKAFNSLRQRDIHMLHHYVEDNTYEYLLKDTLNRLIKNDYDTNKDDLTPAFTNKEDLTTEFIIQNDLTTTELIEIDDSSDDDYTDTNNLSQEYIGNDDITSTNSNDSFSDNLDTSRDAQSPLNPSAFLTSIGITPNHPEEQCGICYKSFGYKSERQLHQLDHFGITPYRCEFCSAYFALSSQYYNHSCSKVARGVRNHPRPNATVTKYKNMRGFVCHICWKTFRRFDTLRRHETTHTGERPFKCKACGKLFSQWSGKDRHLCIRNNDKKLVDTTCGKCGRIFKNSKYLEIHEHTHYFVGQTNFNNLPDLYSMDFDNEAEIN